MPRLFLNIGACILRSYCGPLFISHYKEFFSASSSLYFFLLLQRNVRSTKFVLRVTFRFPRAGITPSCSWRYAGFERGQNPVALWCHPGQWAVHCKWEHADRYSPSLPGLPPEHHHCSLASVSGTGQVLLPCTSLSVGQSRAGLEGDSSGSI